VLNSTYSQYVDYDTGKVLFNTLAFALRLFSVQDRDIAIRGSEMLAALWRFSENDIILRNSAPQLNIKSRMGACLLYDMLWHWRQYRRAQKASTQTSHGAPPLTPVCDKPRSDGFGEMSRSAAGRSENELPQAAEVNAASEDANMLACIDWSWDYDFMSVYDDLQSPSRGNSL